MPKTEALIDNAPEKTSIRRYDVGADENGYVSVPLEQIVS